MLHKGDSHTRVPAFAPTQSEDPVGAQWSSFSLADGAKPIPWSVTIGSTYSQCYFNGIAWFPPVPAEPDGLESKRVSYGMLLYNGVFGFNRKAKVESSEGSMSLLPGESLSVPHEGTWNFVTFLAPYACFLQAEGAGYL